MAHLPTWCCTSIYKLDLDVLKENGIKYIFTDLDNTLAPYNVYSPSKETIEFVENLKNEGFIVIVVSNNTGKRVSAYANELNVKYISGAKKPFTSVLKKFIQENNISLDEFVLIGDQMMTDIKCANRLGCKCILTWPLSNEEAFVTYFNRKLDNYYRKKYKLDSKEKIDRSVKR